MNYTQLLENEHATLELGKQLAASLGNIHVIYLEGVLGAGKTTFTRGFLHGMGYAAAVKSPTYTLVETYPLAAITVHHFDLYRIGAAHELEEMGFRDYFAPDTLCLIEWPERAPQLPPPDLICLLEVVGLKRNITITAHSEAGKQCVVSLGRISD